MSKKQPEALRLAKMLTADEWPGSVTLVSYARECVAELLRLHAENETLRASHGQAPAGATPAESVERIVHLRAYRERRIYVAGPMTGLPEYNFPLFNSTAVRLRSEGWHVENPAEHGHVEGAGWADYLRWDISRIATCGAIYLLPGWSNSKGATLEVHIAGVLGLEVLLADGAEAPTPQPPTAQAASSAVLKAIRKANMQLVRTGDNAFMLVPYKVATAQAAESQPALDRDRIRKIFMAHGFTVKEGQTDLKQYVYDAAEALVRAARAPADSVTAPAGGAVAGPGWQMVPVKPTPEMLRAGDQKTWVLPALDCWRAMLAAAPTPPAQAAGSVLEDAALWHWLAEYLVGTRTDLDDEIVASETVNDLRKLVEAARKQGANHDNT